MLGYPKNLLPLQRQSPDGEMVDALVSGASVERRVGSSPILGTEIKDNRLVYSLLSFSFMVFCPLFAHLIENSTKKGLSIQEEDPTLMRSDIHRHYKSSKSF